MKLRINIPFKWGTVIITPAAQATIRDADILTAFGCHVSCDWGEISDNDWEINNDSVLHGVGLLHSVYKNHDNVKFWIITAADRSVTTVLLPSDY